MCRLERARRQELRLGPELRMRVQERQARLVRLERLVRQVPGLPAERRALGTPGPRGLGNLPGGD